MESPFGPSSLLVAEADGAVIGLLAYMRWRFRAGEQTLETMRGVDFALHPDHRRPGASSALTKAAVEHFPSGLSFVWGNPNARGTPVSIRTGWRDVGGLSRFVSPRASLLRTIWRGATKKTSMSPPGNGITAGSAAELLGDDEYMSSLLARIPERADRLTTARDLDYLRWRYCRFGEYQAVRVEEGERGRGMAIFRRRCHGRLSLLDVCELLVDTGDPRATRHLIRRALGGAPADLVSWTFASRREAARRGFIQLPQKEVLIAYPLRQNHGPDPTLRSSWALSRGDLELL
jgi:hypothetical protein